MRNNNRSGLHEKGCLNVQAYVDVKKIATIAAFLESIGELYAPQYGVISQFAINYLMAIIEEQHSQHLVRFNSTADALQWLDERRFSMAQFKPDGNRRISRTLAQESESRAEFGQPECGLRLAKSSMLTVPQTPHSNEKLIPLNEQVQLAKMMYREHGIIAEGFEYLFDPSIQNPHLTTEQLQKQENAVAYMQKIMPEYLEQQEERMRPRTEEEVQANLREGVIKLLLKNATSIQQMPIPKDLEPFTLDPSVIAEVAQRLQPYIEQRERDSETYEAEKKKRLEETARRQVGASE